MANTLDPARPTSGTGTDLVNRDFTAPAPDRLWVADATSIPTGQGVFWLATVRDAFSNRIVGWKTSDRATPGSYSARWSTASGPARSATDS